MTKTQRMTLDFIADHIDRHGYPPSVKDIAREFSLMSTNGVSERLAALERDGFITRTRRTARSIVLTQLGLENTGRLSPDRIRTSIARTRANQTGQLPVPAVASSEKENEP